jgi:hypothetical protein
MKRRRPDLVIDTIVPVWAGGGREVLEGHLRRLLALRHLEVYRRGSAAWRRERARTRDYIRAVIEELRELRRPAQLPLL